MQPGLRNTDLVLNRYSLCNIWVKQCFHPITNADEERESENVKVFTFLTILCEEDGTTKESTRVYHKVEEGDVGLYFGFCRKSEAAQAGLGSASSNHFSRLWGIRTVPNFLALNPGVTKAGGGQ